MAKWCELRPFETPHITECTQKNKWQTTLASHMPISSQLSVSPSKMETFVNYLGTHGHLTGLRK